jgi:porphobilinogen synthase
MPYFVVHGNNLKEPIVSMPGNFRFSVDRLVVEAAEIKKLGIQSVLLFGIPKSKDLLGSEAFSEDGVVQKAILALKKALPQIKVITDICICEYTTHGHCAVLRSNNSVKIDLAKTLEIYAKMAVSHAAAGADMVAPSGMMKRQVRAIRQALNKNGFKKVKIMGYSAKYASAFYGPFRDAADSAPAFGDRTSYQMNPAGTHQQALQEIADDIAEGADIVMVKPALAYLDVIREARKKFKKPLAAYNVSGEYSMVKAAAANGWIDGDKVMLEIMTAIQRAGAEIIITYHAKEIAKILMSNNKCQMTN